MPNPSWVTAENVKFNGTLDNAVVLNVTSGIKSLILWDALSAEDQLVLTTFVNNYGGTTPISSAVSGFQVCNFKGLVVGSDSTGLSATANPTSGYATINVSGTASNGSASGLSATILNKSNAARNYTAIVVIDGYIIKSISISGDVGDTFAHLITQINADLGSDATASLSGGNIKITSASTGKQSSVLIQDTGSLFSSLSGYAGISYVTGLESTTYTATIVVDGVKTDVSILGSAAQSYNNLISQINADLGASATAAIINGNIKITSSSTGSTSSVQVIDGNLFTSLTVFDSFSTPVVGSSDLLTTFKSTNAINGTPYINLFKVFYVNSKPAVPAIVKHDIRSIYWNGTVWKYLDNDATV